MTDVFDDSIDIVNGEEDRSTAAQEDDDDDLPAGVPPSSQVEKFRAQKAVFEAWLASDTGKQLLSSKVERSEKDDVDENHRLSVGSIAAQEQGLIQIIKNPREYQTELFERAKRQNTIAVLDTGSGKTLIAVLLLRWIIDGELENRLKGNPRRTAFFLVPSVNLAYQQTAVLQRNLDCQIGRIVGPDSVDGWAKDQWKKLFDDKHAIVCTAEILQQCLSKGFINMRQINLIIFDEAHHAKKNHPYARIIRDFYIAEEECSKRPHIFGMTASPIDGKGDVTENTKELESLLHSCIATTSNMSLSTAVQKPKDVVLPYSHTWRFGQETVLLGELKNRYGHIDTFKRAIQRAYEIAQIMGPWFADTYISTVFSDQRQTKRENDVRKKYNMWTSSKEIKVVDDAVAEVNEAVAWVQKEVLTNRKPTDISSKVSSLEKHLRNHFEHESASHHRCIVFVEQKDVARLLHEYFKSIKTRHTPHMTSGYLTGSSSTNKEDLNFTFKEQILTMVKFRKGEINCLFSTSVAEEGLDVPDCNMVIRFDLCQTMIQYVQSRGRARSKDSTFVHMVQLGDATQAACYQETKQHENTMKRFCNALSEDRYLQVNQDEGLPVGNKKFPVYVIPSTGAKLTFDGALSVLANFVSALPTEHNVPQHPTYVCSRQGQKFVAEVLLPPNCPFSFAIGQAYPKKAQARRSAAFQACIKLVREGHISEHLQPTYQKRLPELRNAALAIRAEKKKQYECRLKPEVWSNDRGVAPSLLWTTVIDMSQDLERPHRPFILLTRNKMPQFPPFPVYLRDGRQSTVESFVVEQTLSVTDRIMTLLSAFTFRIFRDVFSKTYEPDGAQLSYWIAPVQSKTFSLGDDLMQYIDWALLEVVYTKNEYKWTPGASDELLVDKFLIDVWDGGRKWFSNSINPALKPTDPPPADVAKCKKVSGNASILDYTVSLWGKARERYKWSPNQPVIEAEQLLTRRNMLAVPPPQETKEISRACICPEPLRISVLPTDVVAAIMMFPAIIHRLESYLISFEGCRKVGVRCTTSFGLAAFTKDSDNSGDHDSRERINFQHGMGQNYERLEFIGDTFLKMTTSISVFIQNPSDNEFEFHVKRMLMLCNKNLFRVALDLKLYEYIRSTAFSRRTWYPGGLKLLEGKGVGKDGRSVVTSQDTKVHLGDKTVADVSEALIGAAFVSNDKAGAWNRQQWDNPVQVVTKLVDHDDHRMGVWNDYSKTYSKPEYQLAPATAVQHELVKNVKMRHAYHFKYPRLLYSAFLHPSTTYISEHIPNYQRLEFLGDSLLDMVSVTHLFYKHEHADPQWLTEHKMAMVSNKFLGALCVLIGFHRHLRHSNAVLTKQIGAYVEELETAREAAEAIGAKDFWNKVSDPPKCLPDIVEAYVGAMFIDSDFDYAEVQRFFDMHIKEFFVDMSIYDDYANNHPVMRLEDRMRGFACDECRILVKEVPIVDTLEEMEVVAVVMVHNQVVAYDKSKSARYGRTRVANMALGILEEITPSEFADRFRCRCKSEGGMEGGVVE